MSSRPPERPSPGVVQLGGLLPSLEAALRHRFGAVAVPSADPAEIVAAAGSEVRVAVTSGRTGVSAALMDAWPGLGAIVNYGVGYEKTDVGAARARGIQISNTPDVLTDCVADLAVGALIAVARRIVAADRFVRDERWLHEAFPLGSKVSGGRVGILGLGRIGTAIARRLTAFGMPISYHSRNRVDACEYRYAPSPLALASESDFLVVAAAGGPGSAGVVSREVLAALGPDGYLVNVSRGDLVDESALVAALTSGTIAGAALDVFANEPRVPPQLLALDNVVLLPHIGSATRQTRDEMASLVIANIDRYLGHGSLVTPV